uniref:Uncharacterized protein n=1 Tax=viral metagenome TaxID=1070528 RepID=A0A6M3J0Y9_9ZZZZ
MIYNLFFLVDIEEVLIEGFIQQRPALDEAIRDWKIIAHEPDPGTRKVIHVVVAGDRDSALADRLTSHPAYLAGRAIAPNAYLAIWNSYPILAKHIILCSWMVYSVEFLQDILTRGTIADWEAAGSPARVENYIIPHLYAGV